MKRVIRDLGIKTEDVAIRTGVTNAHPAYEHLHPKYHRSKMFAAIRHPVTWLESHFRYQTMHEWRRWEMPKWHPLREIEDCRARDFSDFVHRYLAWHSGFISEMFQRYIGPDWFAGVSVMRQETLRADLSKVLESLGCKELRGRNDLHKMDAINVTQPDRFDMPWLPGQKDRVLEAEKTIIDRFYSKETQLAV